MPELKLKNITDNKDGKKILYASYLREDFVERSLVVYLAGDCSVESIYFSSYRFGSTEWVNGHGLQEYRVWENEEQAEAPTYLTRRYTARLSNGMADKDYARKMLLPDILDNVSDKEFSKMIKKIVTGKESDIKIDINILKKTFN